MDISSRYNPSEVEKKWYQHWKKAGYFRSTPDERESYSIAIPPPNVTGILHMGHMLNNTIQDVLIRRARQEGKNACWVPGTDHASIATEAKVVRWLREEKGLKKSEVGRERFVEYAWEWTEKYGGIILSQLERLGASCDWDRTAFTMDDSRSKQVIEVFVDLHRKGKLYRDYRMVNWDPQAKTVLSNEEVIYAEEQTNLYHVKYPLVDEENVYLIIATTRPETILGDTAIAVHPDDKRYQHLIGKRVQVPLIGRKIPIIADSYVDQSFGTGALKVTPAHDVNDYDIGKRHQLEVIDVLTDAGRMSEAAQFFVGDDLDTARKKMIIYLKEKDLLEKLEPYQHSVGRSERTNATVEPRLSLQWYVNMREISEPALTGVMTDDIEFFPKNMKNTYRHWMENIRDWCISRQLWWGHRIPAWYFEGETYVAVNADEALQMAQQKTHNNNLTIADLQQDEDVLDTWFSSWLWPFSVFDGLHDNPQVKYYYPTDVVVTGWDIMFLWVARMAMAGYEWKGERPFKHVYFTGMVRDKQRRKMQKSLGNSPDALGLIDKFGADGVRFGILSSSPAGGDVLFEEKLCEQGRNFCNKIWNALRLIKGWAERVDPDLLPSEAESEAMGWLEAKKRKTSVEISADFQNYRLSDALMKLYSFIWGDFCSWYLELIKPAKDEALSKLIYDRTLEMLGELMILLHPFLPFVTEEVWHQLAKKELDCMMMAYPELTPAPTGQIEPLENLKEVIVKIRDLRNKNGLKAREPLALKVLSSVKVDEMLHNQGLTSLLRKSAYLSQVERIEQPPKDVNLLSFVVGTEKYYLETNKQVDTVHERQ
ncbi:MAG: valine--tRNA ligase, partial [Saprospiraceae bacterium]|nr:valine--tRNA ligase [Saprospiraceae bacterium]